MVTGQRLRILKSQSQVAEQEGRPISVNDHLNRLNVSEVNFGNERKKNAA